MLIHEDVDQFLIESRQCCISWACTAPLTAWIQTYDMIGTNWAVIRLCWTCAKESEKQRKNHDGSHSFFLCHSINSLWRLFCVHTKCGSFIPFNSFKKNNQWKIKRLFSHRFHWNRYEIWYHFINSECLLSIYIFFSGTFWLWKIIM